MPARSEHGAFPVDAIIDDEKVVLFWERVFVD